MADLNFSQREGILPISKEIQLKSMDSELRNSLWNMLSKHYFPNLNEFLRDIPEQKSLYHAIYQDFLKRDLDEIQEYIPYARTDVKEIFFTLAWNRVYDFIEFLIKFKDKSKFILDCNDILSREFAGYVIISGKVTRRISDHEISQIENAMNNPVEVVRKHLDRALQLLSDRDKPDYTNSVKESISAVEAMCQKISGNPNATLGDTLRIIKKEEKIVIPPALNSAFEKLYGYTSTSQGIRHAGTDDSEVTQEVAQFMLTTCCAFVNYLVVVAEKSQIRLES